MGISFSFSETFPGKYVDINILSRQNFVPKLDMVRQSSDLLFEALAVSGVRLDKMCNIPMRNGQNKCKI
jgi:hypothetical protein